jgi:hypothetical protein
MFGYYSTGKRTMVGPFTSGPNQNQLEDLFPVPNKGPVD